MFTVEVGELYELPSLSLSLPPSFLCQGRLPCLVWVNKSKGNFMLRCSQPLTGAAGKVCPYFYHDTSHTHTHPLSSPSLFSPSPLSPVVTVQHSKEDEQLVQAALSCGPQDGHLTIFDARSFSAATGNKIMVHTDNMCGLAPVILVLISKRSPNVTCTGCLLTGQRDRGHILLPQHSTDLPRHPQHPRSTGEL